MGLQYQHCSDFFSEMRWGKAMVACANPDSGRKKNVRAKLRGEGDNIKFIDLRFERGQVVGFGKGRRGQDVP